MTMPLRLPWWLAAIGAVLLARAPLGSSKRVQKGLAHSISRLAAEVQEPDSTSAAQAADAEGDGKGAAAEEDERNREEEGASAETAEEGDDSANSTFEDNISAGVPYVFGPSIMVNLADVANPTSVDFSFMTEDFEYVGKPKGGLFSWFKKWRKKRPQTSEKEELARGHFCAARGSREQTYFASSLCYWLPDISNAEPPHQGLGFLWRGGIAAPGDVQLCEKLGKQGRCIRCSVCHDNAENEDRMVEWTSFEEELPLDPECLKETDIERNITQDFEKANPELATENQNCSVLKGRYDSAVRAYEENQRQIEELTQQVEVEIPAKIQDAQYNINQKLSEWNSKKDAEWRERDYARDRCLDWRRIQGWQQTQWWSDLNNQNVDTENILYAMPKFWCRRPSQPNDQDSAPSEWAEYNEKLKEYNACQDCDQGKDRLEDAFNRRKAAEKRVSDAEQTLRQLQASLESARVTLQQEKDASATLLQAKEAMKAEWEPRREGCEQTFEQYSKLLAQDMSSRAPEFYEKSCEKACIELQRKEGCGVMEGGKPDDVVHNGGVTPTCRPPYPSWVKAPFSYAPESQKETEDEQCARIFEHQTPAYSQNIIKTGVLWKKARWWGRWDQRYFVLESGDEVRSAALRYFDKEPSQADAKESFDKKISVWDARRIEKQATRGKDGSVCFKLVHFYRTYTLCVPHGEAASGDAKVDRDDWVNLIMTGILYPGGAVR